MTTIRFITHEGVVHQIDADDGSTVMQAAVDSGVPGIDGSCGGNCACATCQVYVDPAWADRLPAITELETKSLEFAVHLQPNSRLCCRLTVGPELDGLVLSIPSSQY